MAVESARITRPRVQPWAEVKTPAVLIAAVATVTALTGLFALIGADARWLAALGHVIATRHQIPDGVPFAVAPTAHWPNVIVLAELSFHWLESTFGDRGLMLAQLLAVAVALAILARDALAGGASAPATAGALLVASFGALPSLAIARVQMFSLILFPILVALLRSEARTPTGRIWLVAPLIALWSNLHGAVLVGLGILGVYLLAVRLREQPLTAVGVGLAALAAVCVTPAGLRTVSYYHGVLTNVAAQRGQGLWGPLSPTAALDIVLILATAWLVFSAVRRPRVRARPWELAVILMLAALTLHTSRGGVWLLFFLVAPAARALQPKRTWDRLVPVMACVSVAAVVVAVARGPLATGASPGLIARVVSIAHGAPVLAADSLAEQVALAGGRIWAGNPIDAFSRHDQAAYLDWLQGLPQGRTTLSSQIAVVLVRRHTAAQALTQKTVGFVLIGGDTRAALYERRP